MTEEIWRPIVGYEGLYEVSSYGRVRSLDKYVKSCYGSYRLQKGKVLSPAKGKNGYLKCNLYLNKNIKTVSIHRLVAQVFLPNPENLTEVNHKDEDKTNNSVENLEWCDRNYNLSYGTARIRRRDTLIKNGSWTGLSRKEYMKKYDEENRERRMKYFQDYREKHKEKRREYQHQYYLKRKAGL